MHGAESDKVVLIEAAGRLFALAPGERVLFGRSRECTIRLAHEPPDTQVSRNAGALSFVADTLLVHNLSETQPLYLQAPRAPRRTIEPHGATTALPHQEFAVVVAGSHDVEYVLNVDAKAVPIEVVPPSDRAEGTRTTPAGAELRLTAAQRRMLVALCAPLLIGQSEPATYSQIAEVLNLRQGYVRNVLKRIREELAGHGVPGMQADDGDRSPDLRLALAQWAIWSGALD